MKLKLSTKAVFIIAGMIVIGMASSIAALVYAWQMRQALDDSISKNAMEMLAAAELDIALIKQRGFMTFHILDAENQKWMDELDNLKPVFRASLEHFKQSAVELEEKALLVEAEDTFTRYDALRNKIVGMYKEGERAMAKQLTLTDLDKLYRDSVAKCDQIVELNKRDILEVLRFGEKEFRHFKGVVVISISLIILLGSGLIWLLVNSVFKPLGQMVKELKRVSGKGSGVVETPQQDDLATLISGLKMFISEATETRSDLEKSRHDLVHAKRLAAIGNTVAQVAHEIKNRLVVLGGFARSIEKRAKDTEGTRTKAQIISKEVDKLEHMLKQITEFSKPIRLETKIISLNNWLEEVVAKITDFTGKNIIIKMSPSSHTIEARIDAERMEQVVVNLIKNAMEAMEEGGTISISTCLHEQRAALIIKDDGSGMSDEVKNYIFEPFFTTKKEGTGLGLAISRQIVLDHGGDMRCESSPDEGTTFTITFPLARGGSAPMTGGE